jgi:hypothetical protein
LEHNVATVGTEVTGTHCYNSENNVEPTMTSDHIIAIRPWIPLLFLLSKNDLYPQFLSAMVINEATC